MNAAEARDRVTEIHRQVAVRAHDLTAALPGGLTCHHGCAECCVDDLTVFAIEADLIRYHYRELLSAGSAHPPGACAFLDAAGGCRIYAHRPYVCRTQGLPLCWVGEDDRGAEVEMRDICPLNEEPLGVPLLALDPSQCWQLGEFEGVLASLQAQAQGSFELRREPLRGLFGRDIEQI